jgi:hypothetical protein
MEACLFNAALFAFSGIRTILRGAGYGRSAGKCFQESVFNSDLKYYLAIILPFGH